MALTREHLGVSAEDEYCDVTDPVTADFYKNVWLKQASINTTIYDKVWESTWHLLVVYSSRILTVEGTEIEIVQWVFCCGGFLVCSVLQGVVYPFILSLRK